MFDTIDKTDPRFQSLEVGDKMVHKSFPGEIGEVTVMDGGYGKAEFFGGARYVWGWWNGFDRPEAVQA